MPERLELTKNAQFYITNNAIDNSIINYTAWYKNDMTENYFMHIYITKNILGT